MIGPFDKDNILAKIESKSLYSSLHKIKCTIVPET